jgi:hypothetical protein
VVFSLSEASWDSSLLGLSMLESHFGLVVMLVCTPILELIPVSLGFLAVKGLSVTCPFPWTNSFAFSPLEFGFVLSFFAYPPVLCEGGRVCQNQVFFARFAEGTESVILAPLLHFCVPDSSCLFDLTFLQGLFVFLASLEGAISMY